MFSFDKICFHSMEYFHLRKNIFSFDNIMWCCWAWLHRTEVRAKRGLAVQSVSLSQLFHSFMKMDFNWSIIHSEVRQALEEYLQSNTNRSANAGETGGLEGSCKLILLCTSLLMLSL